MYRAIALLFLLLFTGCAYKQGLAKVVYQDTVPIELFHIKRDKVRWYIRVPTQTFGDRIFFLDTGYGNTTCDDDFIAELGLETRGRIKIYGESGHTIATKAILPPFTLGGHQIERLVCTVRDLNTTSSIRDPKGFAIAGVLGMDALRVFRTHFKPQEARVILTNPNSAPKIEHGLKLRREWGFGLRPTIRTQINNKKRWLILDTGASITLANGRTLDLDEDQRLSSAVVTGSGSGQKVRSVQRYEVKQLGLVGLEPKPGILYDRRRGPFLLGLLGLNVLGEYDQEYDWTTGRARFTPIDATPLPIYPPDSAGTE